MNYFIKNIEDPKKPYPNHVGKTFLSLSDYRTMAIKGIKYFGPRLNIPQFRISEMLSGEDYISEVVRCLATADWTYEDGKKKTPRSWRNQHIIYCLQTLGEVPKTKANKVIQSLDQNIGKTNGETEISLYELRHDLLLEEPVTIMNRAERKARVSTYINFLLMNTELTPQQRKVIQLKYFEGIDSLSDIGKSFKPPVSRQDVSQLLRRSLYKLRQTALGTQPQPTAANKQGKV